MKELIENIQTQAINDIESSSTLKELEIIKISYLGKKGKLTSILKDMRNLTTEERPLIGKFANIVRDDIEDKIKKYSEDFSKKEMLIKLEKEKIDISIPSKKQKMGKRHPLSIVLEEIEEIFFGMGFSVETGPDIEQSYYNFDALNIGKNHPSRDPRDTFYIDSETVLRSQTSPVQIRVMENQSPPLKIISPGKVFRADSADATHSPIFHQIEGLVIDKGISMADLKGTLETFIKTLFGEDTKTRFRPHHFPFTEPSAEIDISCFACNGSGCSLCKNEGYIEILGAGMVHNKVLSRCNINPDIYSGFAFGMGLERIVMKKFKINDIRIFFENDSRFINNF